MTGRFSPLPRNRGRRRSRSPRLPRFEISADAIDPFTTDGSFLTILDSQVCPPASPVITESHVYESLGDLLDGLLDGLRDRLRIDGRCEPC